MAKTLKSVVDDVQTRLGDTAEDIWARSEIRGYVQEGYKRLTMATEILWETAYMEDQESTGTVTAEWEKAYIDPGEIFYGVFHYTSDMEKDYLHPGADLNLGPTNHTTKEESSHLSRNYFRAVHTLPKDLYRIERATWDHKRLSPLMSADLEDSDTRYQETQGEVVGYIQDKDGLRSFRKYRVPSTVAEEYTVTGSFGILRTPDDISSETVTGTWGIPRRLPGMHPMGGFWGLPRRPFKETSNTRIEYFRRGRTLTRDDDEFEIPDHYVKYVRHFTLHRALGKEGPGQDLVLSKHFGDRYIGGLARIKTRKNAMSANRTVTLGGTSEPHARPPKPRLPWQYGRVV